MDIGKPRRIITVPETAPATEPVPAEPRREPVEPEREPVPATPGDRAGETER